MLEPLDKIQSSLIVELLSIFRVIGIAISLEEAVQ
jgi:hypothetical protein